MKKISSTKNKLTDNPWINKFDKPSKTENLCGNTNYLPTKSPGSLTYRAGRTSASPFNATINFKKAFMESTESENEKNKLKNEKDFKRLYNKIFDNLPGIQASNNLKSDPMNEVKLLTNRTSSYTTLSISPVKDLSSTRQQSNKKNGKYNFKLNLQEKEADKNKYYDGSGNDNSLIKNQNTSIDKQVNDSNAMKSEGSFHHRFAKSDSKFEEIQMLKRKVKLLQEENIRLKEEIREIDEFKIALDKDYDIERFNEKRCDLLKAQLRKQQRYINYILSSFKITKKFYKDTVSILNFLIELNEKYIKPENLRFENSKENELRKNKNVDYSSNLINEFLKNWAGNTEGLRKFVDNFNEAYEKIKTINEKNEEIKSVFNVAMTAMRSIKPNRKKISNELQKKLKYNYLLSSFIKQYQKFFPVYTVFTEFETKDKNDFGLFLSQLIKISSKVDEIVSKIKNFRLFNHNKFIYATEVPDFFIENTAEINDYFDISSSKKKLCLNGEEIFECEKRLSQLLTELITFHKILTLDKNIITANQVMDLNSRLRSCIESLVSLGVTIDLPKNKQSIIIINKLSRSDDLKDIPIATANTSTLEKLGQYNVSIYQLENENQRNSEDYTEKVKKYLEKLLKLNDGAKGLYNPEEKQSNQQNETRDCIQQLDSLFRLTLMSNKELYLLNQTKELELRYLREYTGIVTTDAKRLNRHIDSKSELINCFTATIMDNIKDIMDSYTDWENNNFGSGEYLKRFQAKFKICMKGITDHLNKIMNPKTNILKTEIQELEECYRKEYKKIEEDLYYFSQRMTNIQIYIK